MFDLYVSYKITIFTISLLANAILWENERREGNDKTNDALQHSQLIAFVSLIASVSYILRRQMVSLLHE